MKLLNGNVLIRTKKPEGGVAYVEETLPDQGEVVSASPKAWRDDYQVDVPYKAGDVVAFNPHAGREFTLAGEKLVLVDSKYVLGIVE